MAENHKEIQVFEVRGVNLKSLASTKIGTTQGGSRAFHPLYLVAKCVASSSPIAVATISVGTNSSSYNNIVPVVALTGLLTLNDFLKLDIVSVLGSIAADTDIYVKVTIAALATSITGNFFLFGFYD